MTTTRANGSLYTNIQNLVLTFQGFNHFTLDSLVFKHFDVLNSNLIVFRINFILFLSQFFNYFSQFLSIQKKCELLAKFSKIKVQIIFVLFILCKQLGISD